MVGHISVADLLEIKKKTQTPVLSNKIYRA
jgi:hypothetical protein